MGYAYEDDDLLENEEEEEELDENLVEKKPKPQKKKAEDDSKKLEEEKKEVKPKAEPVVNKEVKKVIHQVTMDDLLKGEGKDANNYSVANLLDSEEKQKTKLEDLLTKKDQKFFDAYLHAPATKFTEKKFNFAAFFFGGYYLLYRKIYLIGVIWLLICVGVQLLFPIADIKWYITALFEIVAAIACGFMANQLIITQAGTKIVNLKIGKEKDMKDKLSKSGGVNILIPIVAYIIFTLCLSLYYKDTFISVLNYEKATYSQYDGVIKANEDINIIDYITLDIPDDYVDAYLESYRYNYFNTKDANVSLELVMTESYKSSYDLIKDIALYEYLEESDVQNETYNGRKWYYVNTGNSFFASVTIDKNIYLLRHTYCGNAEYLLDYDVLLNSIK